MQHEIGSYDAKIKLPEILRRVESGEEFVITNRGKPIADLTPSRASSQVKVAAAIKGILRGLNGPGADEELSRLKSAGRK
ncbi:MAG: type II toxin-antitoxin system prevent-host-death family antitoxin [Gammaproteobacteria bacterium]|nr:type II toxin-antitoxin system prevent-host-death family antitoxin [Gammaproteobacteria bacterium]